MEVKVKVDGCTYLVSCAEREEQREFDIAVQGREVHK
jgi:hypothetical protein